MTINPTDSYPSQGERDDIARSNQDALRRRIEECKAADFNVGAGGVAGFAESVVAANELATVENGRRRLVSRAPLVEVNDGGFSPDGATNISKLYALVVDGDTLYAVSTTETGAGTRLGLKKVGYGGVNTTYTDRPSAELLGAVDVQPASTGELPNPENKAAIRAGGLRVEYDDGGIFVGSDPEQGNDRPITLVDAAAGIRSSDKLMAKNGLDALLRLLADNGSSWKP